MELFNYKTGKWEEHREDGELDSKIASGNYGLPKDVKIPIVTPDGALATVPSENATKAFQQGYRFQTKVDRDTAEAKGLAEIREKHFGDDPLLAAGLGAARTATFGLSDVGLAAGGLGEETAAVKELNPTASLVGEVAGALAPVGAPALGAKLGQEAAAGVQAAIPASAKAAQILSKMGSAAAGSAVEGAVFGAGQGVSESALGDPTELVENIAAGGLQGALWGGLLGGAFQGARDASPFISGVVKAGAGKAADVVSDAARAVTERGVGKMVAARLGPEAGRDFQEVIRDVAGRRALESTGDDVFQSIAREAEERGVALKDVIKSRKAEANQLAKEVQNEMAAAEAKTRNVIQNAPKEIKEQIAAKAEKMNWDTAGLIDDLVNQIEASGQNARNWMTTHYAGSPGQKIGSIVKTAEEAAAALKSSGSRTAQDLGNSIRDSLRAELGDSLSTAGIDIPAEHAIASRLRDRISGYKLKPADRAAIEKLSAATDSVVSSHYIPDLAKEMGDAASMGQLVDNLRGMLSTKASSVHKLPAVMGDPIRAKALDEMLQRAEEFYPAAAKLRQGFADVAGRQQFLREVQGKIREGLANSVGGKLTTQDTEMLLELIGKPGVSAPKSTAAKAAQASKLADDISKLKETMAQMQSATPLDRYVAYSRALGKDVSAELEALRPLVATQEKIAKLEKLSQKGAATDGLGAAALWLISPKLAAAKKAIDVARTIGTNPAKYIQALGSIERMAQKGAQTLASTIDKTVSALISGKALKIARSSALAKTTLPEQRKEYGRQKEILTKLADPAYAANYIEQRLPHMPEAPGVQASLGAHIVNTAAFLRSKLPEDPMENNELIPGQSDFEPSDTEMAQFLRYSTAAENPSQVVENIGSLTATPEEVETLQALYPTVYKRLQDQVVSGITNSGKKLAYPQRAMLSEMLDIPLDYSLRPEFVSKMQSTYAQEMPENQGGRPAGGGNPKIKVNLDAAESVATPAQRATYK